MRKAWDKFVSASRNGTFLFRRDFMEYHGDRFEDASLLIYDDKKPLGLLPANRSRRDAATVESHGGLTYGGLLLGDKATALLTGKMLHVAAEYYLAQGYKQLVYKPTPYIYHRQPTEEPLYWLYRAGATLETRNVSTAVSLRNPLPLSELRRRKCRMAQNVELRICSEKGGALADEDYPAYWDLLTETLEQRHGVRPVHSLEEIKLLKSLFPNNIKLYTAERDGALLAGVLCFDCGNAVHAQYIAAGTEARACGALDLLLATLLEIYAGRAYFDFGISNEPETGRINEGLIFQKEGFGGRAVCYDRYLVSLDSLVAATPK
ncbi:MAG: GNAT family N-acetyltransferase [Alloprevotella sp.]